MKQYFKIDWTTLHSAIIYADSEEDAKRILEKRRNSHTHRLSDKSTFVEDTGEVWVVPCDKDGVTE